MALTKRTLFVITLFVINIARADKEYNPLHSYLIDSIRDADQLLRGSGEENDEPPPSPSQTSTKSDFTTFTKDFSEDDYQTTFNTTLEDDTTETTTASSQKTEATTKPVTETAAVAEEVPKPEEIPKPESLINKTDEVSSDSVDNETSDDDPGGNDDNVNETTTTMATTLEAETATEKPNFTTIDQKDVTVYNTTTPRDIVANVSTENNSANTSKTTWTTLQVTSPMETRPETTTATKVSEMDPASETTGLRNPKTENTETKTPIDKRNDDLKPRTSPAASKSATLKSWLEDPFLRPPAGILVPLRQSALRRALAVWNDLHSEPLNVTDIVIVGFDSVGINWRSRHSLQPPNADKTVGEALSKLLRKYQGVYAESDGDHVMKALTSAAKLVPYDSSLFIITDVGAGDGGNLPLALKALVHKRLKVYTIWTDPGYPSEESELALQDLRNVSSQTEGEVLPYSLKDMDTNTNSPVVSNTKQWDKMDQLQPRTARLQSRKDENYDTLLIRRVGGEALSLGIPVENGITALRVHIEGNVEHAILYPPNDAPQIDIYNMSSVRAFSPASKTEKINPREVLLVFPGANPDSDLLSVIPMTTESSPLAGIWHLTARCDTCDYRLVMKADSQIHLTAEDVGKENMRLRVVGPFSNVRESALIDDFGNELTKLPFSSQPNADESQDPLTNTSELETEIPIPSVKVQKAYVRILGRNNLGEPFVRIFGPINHQEIRIGRSANVVFPDTFSELETFDDEDPRIVHQRLRYNASDVLPRDAAASQIVNQQGQLMTTLQIGLSTRLYGAPGTNLQLYYEVTNYREQSVRFNFLARGQYNSLTGISESSRTLAAGETANIVVSLRVSGQAGSRELITFTASSQSNEQVSISSYVYTLNAGETLTDVYPPELSHSFQGSCLGRLGDECSMYTWSATIVARDAVSGLLRLSSSPPGLIYDSNFISGTRERVNAFYRSTCCSPRLSVSAVDSFGNAYSYTIDISNYVTGAAIAAIVLGIVFAILLIALLIFLIYRCVKRRKDNVDIPSYSTSRARNNN